MEEKVDVDCKVGCKAFTTFLKKETYIKSHYHKEIELCYAIEGQKIQRIGKELYHSKPGDLLLVNSHVHHEINTLGYNKSLVLMFEYNDLKRYCPQLDHIRFDLNKNLDSKNEIKKICQKIYDHSYEVRNSVIYHCDDDHGHHQQIKESNDFIWLKSEILKIVYNLIQYHIEECDLCHPKTIQKKKIIDDIFLYIDRHYNQRVCLEDIADSLGYSSCYISHLFKDYTGVTLFDYMNLFRMEKALAELRDTNRSIKCIAEWNGFGNYKNFQKQFLKLYHCTPSVYRNKVDIKQQ